MPVTYMLSTVKNRKKQPLLKLERAKYRSHRVSEQENLETNLFKIDLSRIQSQLNQTDAAVFNDLRYLVGDVSDESETTNLQDGLSYEISEVSFYVDDTSQTSTVNVDVVSKISSRLSRLRKKISRLEKDS